MVYIKFSLVYVMYYIFIIVLLYICCLFVSSYFIQFVECIIDSFLYLVMDGYMSRIFSVQYIFGQDNEFFFGGWDDIVQVIKIFFN